MDETITAPLPELNFRLAVRDGAIFGTGGNIEEERKLVGSRDVKLGVALVCARPVGEQNGGTETCRTDFGTWFLDSNNVHVLAGSPTAPSPSMSGPRLSGMLSTTLHAASCNDDEQ